ncbi:MAG: hypothetical protein AAB447_01820 [Patescibacteria group bacterium]
MNNMLRAALRKNLGLRQQLEKNLLGDKGNEWEAELKKFLRGEICWAPKPKVAKVKAGTLTDIPIVHDDLTHVSTFEVEVSQDFSLDGCPRTGFSYWNQNTTDANFSRSALVPGKKYAAEVYRLNCGKGSQSLVDIGLANKRVLGGARGGALLCSRYGDKLPKDRWVVAIDEKKNLWRDSGDAGVPRFGWGGGGWGFGLDDWSDDWGDGHCVVFFRELN